MIWTTQPDSSTSGERLRRRRLQLARTTPHEEIARSIRAMFSTGVTRFFPTVITGSPEEMLGALRNLAAARESHESDPKGRDGGVSRRGSAHFARRRSARRASRALGPAAGYRGVSPLAGSRAGQRAAGDAVARMARGDALHRTACARRSGREHRPHRATRSRFGTRSAPARRSRRIWATARMRRSPKTPNYIWEQLAEDRLAASFIVDGIHLPDAFLRVALRAKGIERSVLVTDAVMPAMCAPGLYSSGEVEVELKDDQRVVLRGGNAPGRIEPANGSGDRERDADRRGEPDGGDRHGDGESGARGHVSNDGDEVKFLFEGGAIQVLETRVNGQIVFPGT